jgi:uncharacterized protein
MLDWQILAGLCAAMMAAAILFSSVGHGGASLYIALLAFSQLAPSEIRPIALALNIVVAGIGATRFLRAGFFDVRLFWPLAIGGVPAAFLTSQLHVSREVFEPLLATALGLAALRYLVLPSPNAASTPLRVSLPILGLSGALLGSLAGLTGIGGGVYLSPLLIFMRWADPKRAAGIAACFILVNSFAGLTGTALKQGSLAPLFTIEFCVLAVAVALGGWLGAGLGARKWDPQMILRALGLVLGIAALGLVV